VNQSDYRIRLDWGPTGAAAIAPGAAVIAVGAAVIAVVDVLSFSTTLTVAVERGIPVLPFRWGSADASRSARRHGATLGVGRSQVAGSGQVSLSPGTILRGEGIERGAPGRLWLPSVTKGAPLRPGRPWSRTNALMILKRPWVRVRAAGS
jgi:2-phosphosulfolactate phosphatase